MFGRFTERAQRASCCLRRKQGDWAIMLVGTEHILLGLIAEGEDGRPFAVVLRNKH